MLLLAAQSVVALAADAAGALHALPAEAVLHAVPVERVPPQLAGAFADHCC